ncbi:MAG: ComEC/Rec2 family competence protein [Terrimicrobiaceae bacterium]
MTSNFPFLRQRLPFLGLLLAAIGGILFSDVVSWPSAVFCALAGLFLVAGFLPLRGPWILLSVAGAFACAHVWQTRESTSRRLADLVEDGRFLVVAEGRVSSDPAPHGAAHERFTMRVERLELEGKELRSSARVAVVVPAPAPAQGDRVRVTGSLRVIEPPRNPGEFNAKAWMARNGVTCQIEVAATGDLTIVRKASRYSLVSVANRSRQWMENTLRLGISGDPVVCDFLAGMVLGVTAAIPAALQQEFRNTGTFHLFSVSGLHVGMIGLILWQALKIAGVSRRWAVLAIIPALFFYALLTGWKPPSLRAAVMSAIFLIGLTSSRRPVPLNSLCAAAFLILVQWTSEVFNPGFQFSFLVVAAILLLALPLHDLIRKRCHPDPFVPRQLWTRWQKGTSDLVENLGGLASVSLAAWVGSLPLTLLYFHLVSFSALPANLLIVPLAFVIMVTAVLALLGGVFWGTLAVIFNNANWAFSKLLLGTVHLMSCLPASFLYMGSPAPAPVTVTVFDFGAGGGAGIESEGKVWLIDCGPKWQFDGVITPWLHGRGKASPEGLILTHGDARHIGGAAELIGSDPPGVLVESMVDDRSSQRRRLRKQMETLRIPKSLHRAGDSIRISQSATLRILYPPAGILRDMADDKALVVRLDTGRARILFLSDAGPGTREWLLQNAGPELPADIVVQGAHHSGLPMDTAFVDAVRPKLIVSTASHFPESESLDENWVSRIEGCGIRIFRQDLSGAVRIDLHPSGFQATGFFDGSRFSSPGNPESTH